MNNGHNPAYMDNQRSNTTLLVNTYPLKKTYNEEREPAPGIFMQLLNSH